MDNVNINGFWSDGRIRQLAPRGKLVLLYMLTCQLPITTLDGYSDVVAEDVALATGVEISECSSWMMHFVQTGLIKGRVTA